MSFFLIEQSLKIIRNRWEVDVPKPVRNPIPILIGGGGEKKTLRITAQYANMRHSFADPASYRHKIEVLNAWCAEIGRNPQDIEHAVGAPRRVDATELDAYVKSGATHFILGMSEPWNFDAVTKLVKWRNERQG
jgi:alkanesulfonate monooxygenase SsuD/methylene tetrahydromethanopterin reductase-like flavin-dependent oxidoreductase (luciferase family)